MNIDVCNLGFHYGQREVLKNISFSAHEGELISILGPNGAGKSTLFKCILGLLKGFTGSVSLGGENVKNMPARRLAQLVAYIPQSHHPAFNYSVLDIVLMGTAHQTHAFSPPGKKETAVAFEALEQVGMAEMAQRCFLKLSGGEQQLVMIARALAQQTTVLMMDEPTSNLDFGNQIRVMQNIRRLVDHGYTVLMSCHNPQHSLHFSDRILMLCDHEIIAQGLPREVINESLLKRVYGVDVKIFETGDGCVISPLLARGVIDKSSS
jgi:iron complex transport system ATP-binding protein